MNRFFTIGMAGHIDHGKTTLTKALTGVNTDRLKEEKERNISIELGFAPLINEDQLQVSIVDVPGHERFIRQMIAGVAGIDMVILVIAADEGIMPQTQEHLDILSLLGIHNGLAVITKIDQTDEELLEIVIEDVKETLEKTFLNNAPIFLVDSLSQKGIPELKVAIRDKVMQIEKRENKAPFRLPIDQVFTLKGQGTVVRGTIYDGEVRQGERLMLLPVNKEVRVRQIQVHRKQAEIAVAGQRTAINLGGISYDSVSRGDVLAADGFYSVSDRIDVVFYPLKDMNSRIKQRQPVKLYVGTSEVMGKIIFFDRNEVNNTEDGEILCQVQLNEKVVVTRGDRFILRNPSPVETIGGGWIIEPNGRKYRFGKKTIDQLMMKKEGTALDRIRSLMEEKHVLTYEELLKGASVTEKELDEAEKVLLKMEGGLFSLHSIFERVKNKVTDLIESFHKRYPMRVGMDKAEIISEMKKHFPAPLLEFAVKTLLEEKVIKIENQYVSLTDAAPTLPVKWKSNLEAVEKELNDQGIEVEKFNTLLNKYEIPPDLQKEFYHYLIHTKRAHILDDDMLIAKEAVEQARLQLEADTHSEEFTLQMARESLPVSRKYLVPLLELFDRLGYTKRMDNTRKWVQKNSG